MPVPVAPTTTKTAFPTVTAAKLPDIESKSAGTITKLMTAKTIKEILSPEDQMINVLVVTSIMTHFKLQVSMDTKKRTNAKTTDGTGTTPPSPNTTEISPTTWVSNREYSETDTKAVS